MSATHRYHTRCTWSGSTAVGYDAYDRTHQMAAPPAALSFTMSSDPAFRGDPSLWNPEQLLVAAAASCQLLSFLAVAARARVDVVAYEDDAEALMPEDDPPTRITTIALRPTITVRAEVGDRPPPEEKLQRLVRLAHQECYIANSVSSEITVEATFEIVPGT
jgi:organic hydroperoxide reductase OsmC/OhrA